MQNHHRNDDARNTGQEVPATVQRPILIVEDDTDQRELLSDLLVLNGYRVIPAGNGKDALETLSRIPVPPALILLDLMMPVMDGYAFLSRFHQTEPQIPVLLMTAEDHPDTTRVAAVLRKPFKPATILSCIRQFLS
jgi:CheY-like chemotaxis protein